MFSNDTIPVEPHISFRDAALKIMWANQLINNLDGFVTRYIEQKPWHVSYGPSPASGQYAIRLGLTEPMPYFIPILIGDIAANLRSSLDFAWMGLVRAANPDGKQKCTLPIATNRKGLRSIISQASIGGAVAKAEWLLLDTIKSHHDFTDGGNKAICGMNELSNWHKHNLIVAAPAILKIKNITGPNFSFGGIETASGVADGLFFGSTDPQLQHEGDPTVDIIFEKHKFVKGQSVIPTLINFSQAATEALKAFCEAFPSPLNPVFD